VKDLYTTLGVGKTADAAEIKRAFRKLTQQFHPDKNPGDKAAEDKFKEDSSAYEVLSDVDKRKNYDEFGDMSLTQGFDAERARAYKNATRGGGGRRSRAGGFPGGGVDESMFNNMGDARGTSFDDLLSQLFGGGRVVDPFGGGGGGRSRGPVSRRGHDIEGEITIDFMDMLRGKVVPLRIESESGTGRTLDVKVPAGIPDGGKLRMRGQGGQGEPSGDILLTVKVAPHPRLKREGQNLLLNLPVTALEAYRGGPVDVPTVGGTVTLKLKPGSQNGQTLRLKGKGIASPGQEPGDLLVTLDVRLPPAGDAELLAALERLQADADPRADLEL
jgi:curved DNA-binding protein